MPVLLFHFCLPLDISPETDIMIMPILQMNLGDCEVKWLAMSDMTWK